MVLKTLGSVMKVFVTALEYQGLDFGQASLGKGDVELGAPGFAGRGRQLQVFHGGLQRV